MPLSVVDLYRKVLPRTNCGDCGHRTCLAFASMVVSEKLPLDRCPHLAAETVARIQPELDAQHAAGKWTRRDLAADALTWARQRAAAMALPQVAERTGGTLAEADGRTVLVLPYFEGALQIAKDGIRRPDGGEPDRWEQVFILNHLAQGGSRQPTGRWRSFKEIPNTVSKIKSMRAHVEVPLAERFSGRRDELARRARAAGGVDATARSASADLAIDFQPLPRVPVRLLFWDADPEAQFAAEVRLSFDDTIVEHLDIESILFLSEHLARRLLDG